MPKTFEEILEDMRSRFPPGVVPATRKVFCQTCNDTGAVSAGAPIGHPMFGKIFPCPACQSGKSIANGASPDEYGLLPSDRALAWGDVLDLHTVSNTSEAKMAIKATLERGYGWVYLWGNYGTAKTTLLKIAVAEYLRKQALPAVYARMSDIMDEIRAGYDSKTPNTEAIRRLRWWSSVPLLAIDEAEKVNETGMVEERRFQLLDTRYEAATRQRFGITLIAANVAPRAMPATIASRISDGRFTVVHLTGKDFRPGAGDMG